MSTSCSSSGRAPPPSRRAGREEPDPAKTKHQRAPAANDLSRYERPREEGDDFRHRMLANVAALAFTVALTAIGIWLAVSIADLRKTQDCVLMGRRDCARISVTPQGYGVRLNRSHTASGSVAVSRAMRRSAPLRCDGSHPGNDGG